MKTLQEYASEHAGNWRKFDSFAWFEQPDDCENWAIVYTSNRDTADPITLSNEAVITTALEPFEESGDVRFESHSHWACGHVDGFSIRVRGSGGEITDAFKAYAALLAQCDNYPILDESVFSEVNERLQDSAWENWGERTFQDELEKLTGCDILTIGLPDQIDWARYQAAENVGWEWDWDSGGHFYNFDEIVPATAKLIEAVASGFAHPFTQGVTSND